MKLSCTILILDKLLQLNFLKFFKRFYFVTVPQFFYERIGILCMVMFFAHGNFVYRLVYFYGGVASAFSGGGGSHVGVLVGGAGGAGGAGGGAPVFLGGIGGACLHKPGWAE